MSKQTRIIEYCKAFGYMATPENLIDLEEDNANPATAYLYRRAKEAGATYAYVFRTSPPDMPILPARPAVFVASAEDEDEADEIHRKFYLLGNAPFIVVVLPEQVRVYTGFNYPRYEEQADDTFIKAADALDTNPATLDAIRAALSDFNADEIDSGRIWERQSRHLKAANRVDQRLLTNLQRLGDELAGETYKLSRAVAHSLIGKYIYIRYLEDRKILSPEWLRQNNIQMEDVLGRAATVDGLRRLVTTLEDRFNGGVFPLPLGGKQAPDDQAVRYVASIFAGEEPDGQLTFDFCMFDFSFIPIELLSSIYEQFLRREEDVNKVGAYYTPEPVADYLVSELNYVKPLELNMRVLDPCCGSGIFLVLAYRRLIEIKRAQQKAEGKPDLTPHQLSEILTSNIYGVERNVAACYVTEFSLILTLLSYVTPPELHRYENFKFPALHNDNIFNCDFFDDASLFWQKHNRFDWIIGNTPWVELDNPADNAPDQDGFARKWIEAANASDRTINRQRVSDAFCWRTISVLAPQGHVNLYIPATTLTNAQCAGFRKQFFTQNTVHRVTNFSNLAYVLFAGRSKYPAATIVFSRSADEQPKPEIIHYGPFVVNQTPDASVQSNDQVWSITIFASEIRTVSPSEVATGKADVWKLALWGTHRDKRTLSRLQRLFPQTLDQLREERHWNKLRLGLSLRPASANEEIDPLPALADLPLLKPQKMTASGFHFIVPEQALENIPAEMHNVRKGRDTGLEVAYAPHLFLTINFAAYSDINFVLPQRQIGLAVPLKDADYLRALSIILSSTILRYYLFFHSSSWGVSASVIGVEEARSLPVPVLTDAQVRELAALHRELSAEEISRALPKSAQTSAFEENATIETVVPDHVSEFLQTRLDDRVEQIFNISNNMKIVTRDFMAYRYQFVQGKHTGSVVEEPDSQHLLEYGQTLAHALDVFVDADGKKHQVKIARLAEAIMCQVALVDSASAIKPVILELEEQNASGLQALWASLKQRFSQWVYIQRNLRIFDGAKVQMFKPARLIDWTRTQALLDSDDIIGEVLTRRSEVK